MAFIKKVVSGNMFMLSLRANKYKLNPFLNCEIKNCIIVRHSSYIPRRALLYVPGNDEKKLKKIKEYGADSCVMDCEDGVAQNMKNDARLTIRKALDEVDFGNTEKTVRINSVTSGLADNDLTVILQAQSSPATLLLPKTDEPSHIEWFANKMSSLYKHSTRPGLIIYVESAVGLLNADSTCRKAIQLSKNGAPFVLEGLVFGSDDYCASIGASRTKSATELLFARQYCVTVAKAHQIQAIDLVYTDYKDQKGLEEQSLEGAGMGFTGKQVIHPNQISIVHKAFTPSQQQINWATELVTSFKDHQQSGKGAFIFRGHMVDMPLLRQAENILQILQATKR